jgi:hypothetical protein
VLTLAFSACSSNLSMPSRASGDRSTGSAPSEGGVAPPISTGTTRSGALPGRAAASRRRSAVATSWRTQSSPRRRACSISAQRGPMTTTTTAASCRAVSMAATKSSP